MGSTGVVLATTIALLGVVAWFDAVCLTDLARAREVRYLTRRMWAIVILLTFPFGGMLYLVYGRVR
jgi:hypothetical protein